MSGALFAALVGLVLHNVAFVHLTGAVRLHWVLGLYALTLVAPPLRPLRERRAYRAAWNAAVVAVFGVLVADAWSTGIRFLLEDGLILAAFCQVHLLNVLRDDQKPDLLFFNSYLIALVTGFFNRELGYSLLFLGWATVFVVALMLRAARPQRAADARRIARAGLHRAGAVLVATALVFALWPRDFEREGLVGDTLPWAKSRARIAFSPEIRLGRSGRVTASERVVLRLRPIRGDRAAVPTHWRGATLAIHTPDGWRSAASAQDLTGRSLDERWVVHGSGEWHRLAGGATTTVRVRCEREGMDHLFAPLGARWLRLDGDAAPERLVPMDDGTLRYASRNTTGLTYQLGMQESMEPLASGPPADIRLAELAWIAQDAVPPDARRLFREATRALPDDADDRAVVAACRNYLANTFEYLLPGAQGAADDLDEFLAGEAGGHCEYFATALGVMLRLHGIPCRLATGYLVHEWSPAGEWVVRERDAHAWLEVWDAEQRAWNTVDPTPAMADATERLSWFGAFRQWVGRLWQTVTTFDASSRDGLWAWVAELPRRLAALIGTRPGVAAAALAAAALAVAAACRRRRRRSHGAQLARTARRLGLRWRDGETPRRLLARAGAELTDDGDRRRLAAAVETHERERYAATRPG